MFQDKQEALDRETAQLVAALEDGSATPPLPETGSSLSTTQRLIALRPLKRVAMPNMHAGSRKEARVEPSTCKVPAHWEKLEVLTELHEHGSESLKKIGFWHMYDLIIRE